MTQTTNRLEELLKKELEKDTIKIKEQQGKIAEITKDSKILDTPPEKIESYLVGNKEKEKHNRTYNFTMKVAKEVAEMLAPTIAAELSFREEYRVSWDNACYKALSLDGIYAEDYQNWKLHIFGYGKLPIFRLDDNNENLSEQDKVKYEQEKEKIEAFTQKFNFDLFTLEVERQLWMLGFRVTIPQWVKDKMKDERWFSCYNDVLFLTLDDSYKEQYKQLLEDLQSKKDTAHTLKHLAENIDVTDLDKDKTNTQAVESLSNTDKGLNMKEDLISSKKVEYEKPLQEIQSDEDLNTTVSKVEYREPVKVIKPISNNNPVMVMFLFGVLLCCVSILALYFINQ